MIFPTPVEPVRGPQGLGVQGSVPSLLVAFSMGRCQGTLRITRNEMVCLHPVPVLKRFATYVTMCCCSFHGTRTLPVIATVERSFLCFAFRAVHLPGPTPVTVGGPGELTAFQTRFIERHRVWDFSSGRHAGLLNPHIHYVDEVTNGHVL